MFSILMVVVDHIRMCLSKHTGMYTKKGKFDLYTLYLKQMNRIALFEPKQSGDDGGGEVVPKKMRNKLKW